MKTSVVIPTYWTREREKGHKNTDVIYDHPTYLDEEGTLKRTLISMKNLNDKNFKLIILLCVTNDDVYLKAKKKVKKIIESVDLDLDIYIFTDEHLNKIKEISDDFSVLSLKGYSNVRNMCLFASYILNTDLTILIDDDEVFENNDFINIAKENIGKRIHGENIYGIAGYYLNSKNQCYDDVNIKPWMTYWNRFDSKRRAFDKIIKSPPAIKKTPFAFGGAMVIHKNLFKVVPFDPKIRRGEDIDYLINSKMFDFDFFLDNRLSIKHLPPKKNHPIWQRFREDIYRFIYEKNKLDSQHYKPRLRRVLPEDLEPYPGEFLKDDLEEKIFNANMMLALKYLSEDDKIGVKECLKNIQIAKQEIDSNLNTFEEYLTFQKKWKKLMKTSNEKHEEIRNILKLNADIKREECEIQDDYKKVEILKRIDGFEDFTLPEIKKISNLMCFNIFKEDDIIFKEGSINEDIFFIVEGKIRIVNFNSDKEEILIGEVNENEIIGETTFVNNTHDVNAIADSKLITAKIKKNEMKKLFKDDTILETKILKLFLDKMHKKLNNINKFHSELIGQNEVNKI